MPDVDFLSPQADECILTTHVEVLSRASKETGVVNGNQLTASAPANMIINVAAGRIKIGGAPLDVDADTVELDAAHETLPRIDIIYRDAAGDVLAAKGTPAAIVDPKQLSAWKSYTAPQPAADIPAGAILGAVYVDAAATAITSGYIWMFAGGVGDISISIASPGSDSYPASEKAVSTGLAARILHSLATAENDFLVASGSGAFVKKTLAEVKTILGLGTAAYTAATAYVTHALAVAENDFLVASGSGTFVKKTLAEVKTILGLGSAAYTASGDYAVAAKGVTGGDSHNALHDAAYAPIAKGVTGGDAHAPATMSLSTTARVVGRKTAGSGAAEECTLSQVLDFIGSAAAGDILYRGASAWARLGKGASGQRLVQGASAPSWVTPSFEMAFPFGDGSAVVVASACCWRAPNIASKIVAARIRSLDAAGAPLSGSITCSLHIHDIDAAIGAAADTFAISSDTDMTETGLSIAVAAGKWITVAISGITSCKQITCTLEMEPT